MSQRILDLCAGGAELNSSSKYRKGNILQLPGHGKVIATGDLHGHRRNFEKITSYADVENNPDTHLIFHEILHGGPEDDFGGCISFHLFFEILGFQKRFPDQVHLIIGNHDTAIIKDSNVLKGGKEMNRAMRNAMKRGFGDDYESVDKALCEYLFSQPLAVRTENRIWISHSLPADRYVETFDATIFVRELTTDDLVRPNGVYVLTWGRRHSDGALEKLADIMDVDLFVLGHQSQHNGWSKAGSNLIILSSEHNHGCLLEFDLDKSYTIDTLADNIVPLASIE